MANLLDKVTAFVLTGGRSSRMGEDKALLQLPDGETLLEHTLALASSVAREAKIVGSREKYSNYAWAAEIVEDVFPDRGPLGGIHAALNATSTELNLVLAVDMPHLAVPLLEYVLQRADNSRALVTLPRTGGRLQTLCAVYRKEFVALAEPALQADRNKIDLLFTPENTLIIEEEELSKAGFALEQFANVNTPAEFRSTVQVKLEADEDQQTRKTK